LLFASFAECERLKSVVWFVAAMSAMGFYYSSTKTNSLDLAPNYAGIVTGIINGFAVFMGMLSPIMVGSFVTRVTRSTPQQFPPTIDLSLAEYHGRMAEYILADVFRLSRHNSDVFGFWQRRKTALEQIEKDPNSDLVDVYKNIRQLRAFVVCVNQISSRSLVSKWHSSAILDRGRVVFVGCQT
jgi:hypothetical protein